MFVTVKPFTGRSISALATLLIVVGMHSVAVHHAEAAIQYKDTYSVKQGENGAPFLAGPSPLSDGPDGLMAISFNKNTGEHVFISRVSTFETWPMSPYDFNVQPGVEIPLSKANLPTGSYRAFLCRLDNSPIRFNCDNQDWGYYGYPTLEQANVNNKAYFFDFDMKNGEVVRVESIPQYQTDRKTKFLDVSYNPKRTDKGLEIIFGTNYFLETSEIDPTNSQKNPTQVSFQVSKRPTTEISARSTNINNKINGTSTATSSTFIFSTTTKTTAPKENTYNNLSVVGTTNTVTFTPSGAGSTSTTEQISADGTYDLNIKFSNMGCSLDVKNCPFKDTYIYTSFVIQDGQLQSTSTPELYSPNVALISKVTQYETCDFTNLSGCLINAFTYLFIPTTQDISTITNIPQTLSTKFPFAYIYDFKNTVQNLYTNPETSLQTISFPFGQFGQLTLLSKAHIQAIPFSSTINLLLGYFIWVIFGFQMYRRGLKIFNTNPL